MSRWFWVISLQKVVGGRSVQSTTVANECDLPDGFSRRTAFEEIQTTAIQMAGWEGSSATVLFFSLEPAVLTPAGGGS